MGHRVLKLCELNRATLARQMLAERAQLSLPAAIELLVGLQAPQAQAHYMCTWTRLLEMQRDCTRLSIPAAIQRLVGLQAQQAEAPYICLWTRLLDFQLDDLARLIHCLEIIKATWNRATLRLLTAADYLRFRATLQPALE